MPRRSRFYSRDHSSYPVVSFFSGFFAFLALFTTISEIYGLWYFYQWGRFFFARTELFFFLDALALASAASVGVLLVISEGLRMGRDVANHSRASREYLRRMLQRRVNCKHKSSVSAGRF